MFRWASTCSSTFLVVSGPARCATNLRDTETRPLGGPTIERTRQGVRASAGDYPAPERQPGSYGELVGT
jgi:hypothetical protein